MARVLVVEDDAQQLGMRCMVLRAAGHEVTAAQSPAAAIDSFRDHRPDIVVMDLRLRGSPTARICCAASGRMLVCWF